MYIIYVKKIAGTYSFQDPTGFKTYWRFIQGNMSRYWLETYPSCNACEWMIPGIE